MNPVQNFLQKIDLVVAAMGTQTDAEGIKENLLASLYLDLTTKIGLDPRNKAFLDQMAANPPKTVEEIDKNIAFVGEKLKETGFNMETAITESSKSVLESFVSKIEPQLALEKVTELRKIVAE